MGSGPHASTPAFTPPASHPSHERAAQAPTRNTRALSPTALDPNGPASAAARPNASSAVSSTARVQDRKSTRLNSSHLVISYAVFCLKKKKKHEQESALNATQPSYTFTSS